MGKASSSVKSATSWNYAERYRILEMRQFSWTFKEYDSLNGFGIYQFRW